MKLVAALLLLFTLPLNEAKPFMVKRQAKPRLMDLMIQDYINNKDSEGLCNHIKQLQKLVKDSRDDRDRNTLQQGLETANKASKKLNNFQCKKPEENGPRPEFIGLFLGFCAFVFICLFLASCALCRYSSDFQ